MNTTHNKKNHKPLYKQIFNNKTIEHLNFAQNKLTRLKTFLKKIEKKLDLAQAIKRKTKTMQSGKPYIDVKCNCMKY